MAKVLIANQLKLKKKLCLRLGKTNEQEFGNYSSFQLRITKAFLLRIRIGNLSRKYFVTFMVFIFIKSSKDIIHLAEILPKLAFSLRSDEQDPLYICLT
jgi:hypothetical protein